MIYEDSEEDVLQGEKALALTQGNSRRGESLSIAALPSATLQIDLIEARNITKNSEKKHRGALM